MVLGIFWVHEAQTDEGVPSHRFQMWPSSRYGHAALDALRALDIYLLYMPLLPMYVMDQ